MSDGVLRPDGDDRHWKATLLGYELEIAHLKTLGWCGWIFVAEADHARWTIKTFSGSSLIDAAKLARTWIEANPRAPKSPCPDTSRQ